MIAVWESDISDTFLIPRLNCPIEQTLFKSWGKLFHKQAPLLAIWGLARAQNWEESSESVKFKTSLTQIFSCILLIGNHTVFLVQFGINLHLWVFQKAKLHSPKRLVQFQLFEKLTRAN